MAVHDHGYGVFIDRDEAEFALRDFGHFIRVTAPPDQRYDANTQTAWRLAGLEWTLEPAIGVVQVSRATGHIRIDRQWSWVYAPQANDHRLLAHELGHYQISYVVLLQMVRYLRSFALAAPLLPPVPANPTPAQRDDMSVAILKVVEPVRLRAIAFQDRLNRVYDDCTQHGSCSAGQAQWHRLLAGSVRGHVHPALRLHGVPVASVI
jgi:hypothetical protein